MHWMKIKMEVNLCEEEWRLELDFGLLLCMYEDEDFVFKWRTRLCLVDNMLSIMWWWVVCFKGGNGHDEWWCVMMGGKVWFVV